MDGVVIDYTPYFQSIKDSISDHQIAIESKLDDIRTEIQSLKEESFFVNENLNGFVTYANTTDIANLLFTIVIILGLIFGALVFRHFRK